MSHPHIILYVSNPAPFKIGSIILLEQMDKDEALKVAKHITQETGRRVTVRNADMTRIETIPAASTH